MSEEEPGFGPPEEEIESLQDVLARIEEIAPAETAGDRESLRRFLVGDLPDRIIRLNPWCKLHWKKLSHAVARDFSALRLLYVEIYTAIHDSDRDADAQNLRRNVHQGWPSQNRLNELRKSIAVEIAEVMRELGIEGERISEILGRSAPERIERILNMRAFEVEKATAEGQPVVAWMTKREVLLRTHANSGPLTSPNTGEYRLMWLLTGANPDLKGKPVKTGPFQLSTGAASEICSSILHWFIGNAGVSPNAIRSRFDRQIRDPGRNTPIY